MIFYTDEESRTLRTAVYGAMLLVSHADPGPVLEERFAGLRALANLSPDLRGVLGAARPSVPAGTDEEIEPVVLEALRSSMKTLSARSPEDAADFPRAVLAICREVAEADGVVVDSEDAMVARIEGALGL
jgi:tellurite resistance protein